MPTSADQVWLCPRHPFSPFWCFRLFPSFGRVSPYWRRNPSSTPPDTLPSCVADSWLPAARQVVRASAPGRRGKGEGGQGRSPEHSKATPISTAELGPATRDPLKGTRAGHQNRGPARKKLPGCPRRASKSRASTFHRRTQHSACAGQQRWRPTRRRTPTVQVGELQKEEKRVCVWGGNKHKSSANLRPCSAVIIPGEEEERKRKKKKKTCICLPVLKHSPYLRIRLCLLPKRS